MTPQCSRLARALTPISGGSSARADAHRHLAPVLPSGADSSATVTQCGPGEIALYQAMAFHPGEDFTIESLAAGLTWPVPQIESAIRALVREHCVESMDTGRYRIDRVLHAITRKVLAPGRSTVDWATQAQRMIMWYLCRASAVAELVTTADVHADLVPHHPGPALFASRQDALTWFAVECANTVDAQHIAAEHQWDELVIALGQALWHPLQHHDAIGESATVQRTAADAARRIGDGRREALCRLREGVALTRANSFSAGMRACSRAYHCATHAGRPELQTAALLARSQAQLGAGEPDIATADALSARTIARHCGNKRTHALHCPQLGRCTPQPQPRDIDYLTAEVNALTVLDEHREHSRDWALLDEAHRQHDDATAATCAPCPAWSLRLSVNRPADLAAALRNEPPNRPEHPIRPADAIRPEPTSVRPHSVSPQRDRATEGNRCLPR